MSFYNELDQFIIYIGDDSWVVVLNECDSCKCSPGWVMRGFHEVFTIFGSRAGNLTNDKPWRFLKFLFFFKIISVSIFFF